VVFVREVQSEVAFLKWRAFARAGDSAFPVTTFIKS